MANFKLWKLKVEEIHFVAVLEEVNCEKALLTMFFQLLTKAGIVRTMLRASVHRIQMSKVLIDVAILVVLHLNKQASNDSASQFVACFNFY